tara:strand:+ start:4064 stop:4957 length:894 start_codon:yes stop_codon:yes gene_type:complete
MDLYKKDTMVKSFTSSDVLKNGRSYNDRPDQHSDSLQILILNLMSEKINTENQFKRLFKRTQHNVEITFLRTATYEPKNTPKNYLDKNYKIFSEIKNKHFDGFISTGSAVEKLEFEEVKYWNELLSIFDWVKVKKIPSYFICWAAQAALNHRYGIRKIDYPKKQFGVFNHFYNGSNNNLSNYWKNPVQIPVSRYTGVSKEDIDLCSNLEVILSSPDTGVSLISDKNSKDFYNLNHFEYDRLTLDREYHRDKKNGEKISLPENYYPKNNPNNEPVNCWKTDSINFFNYWLSIIKKKTE